MSNEQLRQIVERALADTFEAKEEAFRAFLYENGSRDAYHKAESAWYAAREWSLTVLGY